MLAMSNEYWVSGARCRLDNARSHKEAQKIMKMSHASGDLCYAQTFKRVVANLPPSHYRSPFSPRTPAHDRLGWINVTYVCAFWREVALQEPTLWANITGGIGWEWSEEMLARSKATPIAFDFHDYHCFPDIWHHLPRIVSLNFSYCSDLIPIPDLRSSPTLLETLILRNSHYSIIPFPDHVFGRQLPSLRRVSLSNFSVSFSCPVFTDLVYLKIWCSSDPEERRAERHAELRDALLRMPALEVLVLEGCLPQTFYSLRRLSPIRMAHLKTLCLRGSAMQCAHVMVYLDFPHLCRLSITCAGVANNGSFAGLAHAIHAHFPGSAKKEGFRDYVPLQVLKVSFDPVVEAWRQCSTNRRHGALRPGSMSTTLPDVKLMFPQAIEDAEMADVCAALPLGGLRAICIQAGPRLRWPMRSPWTTEQWIHALGQCNSLEHVSISGRDAIHFSQAMTCHTDGTRAEDGGRAKTLRKDRLFLPNLQLLTLKEVDFRELSAEGKRFQTLLAECLRARDAVNAAPRLQILRPRYLTRKWMKKLSAIADISGEEGESLVSVLYARFVTKAGLVHLHYPCCQPPVHHWRGFEFE